MTGSTEFAMAYRQRRLRLLKDRDAIMADLKELDIEAKAKSENVPQLRKWVDAEHKGKTEKQVADTVDAVLYGETLGHDLGMVSKNAVAPNARVESSSKVTVAADGTKHDADGVVIEPEAAPGETRQESQGRPAGEAQASRPVPVDASREAPDLNSGPSTAEVTVTLYDGRRA